MKSKRNKTVKMQLVSDRPIKKVSFGIDISKDNFEVSVGLGYDYSEEPQIRNIGSFNNTGAGIGRFITHSRNLLKGLNLTPEAKIQFVMESSGVYYECLAYRLYQEGLSVHVALATKMKNYTKTLKNKSKNDKQDSLAICRYGLEKNLQDWKPMSDEMKKLKELTRELALHKDDIVAAKSILHSKKAAYKTNPEGINRMKSKIKYLERLIKKVNEEIKATVDSNPELKEKVNMIIKNFRGVGYQTVVILLAETDSFKQVTNSKQLVSYSGLDIMENQSGNKTGKARISKKGNSVIRRALYMPALCAIRFNDRMKGFYQRICDGHTGVSKKIGIVAVMRKILCIIYALWKNNTEYNPDYLSMPMAC